MKVRDLLHALRGADLDAEVVMMPGSPVFPEEIDGVLRTDGARDDDGDLLVHEPHDGWDLDGLNDVRVSQRRAALARFPVLVLRGRRG